MPREGGRERTAAAAAGPVPGPHKWLGLAALLLIGLLFQLLLNVWLLCAWLLLTVLGGWLGAQLVLGAGSPVHLERFIRLEARVGAGTGARAAGAGGGDRDHSCRRQHLLSLSAEIQAALGKIVRDFVSSWYRRTVSREPGFELEVREAMRAAALELQARAERADGKALARAALRLCGRHLECFSAAAKSSKSKSTAGGDAESLWRAYCQAGTGSRRAGLPWLPHEAMGSPAAELQRARATVELLLAVLVPEPQLRSRTGRLLVRELLACNVFLPLVGKLSDPDSLNSALLEMVAKKGKGMGLGGQQGGGEGGGGEEQQQQQQQTPSQQQQENQEQQQQHTQQPTQPEQLQQQPLENHHHQQQQHQALRPEVPASLPLIREEADLAVPDRTPATPKPRDASSYDEVDLSEVEAPHEADGADADETADDLDSIGKPFRNGAGHRDYRQRPDKLTLFYSCEEYDPDDLPPFSDARKDSADDSAALAAEERLAERLAPSEPPPPFEAADDGGADEPTTAGQFTILDTDVTGVPPFDQNLESLGFENVSDDDGKDETFSKLAASSTVLAHETIRILSRQQSFQEKEECLQEDSPASNSLDVRSAGPNLPTYTFEPLCSPDTPVVIHNLRICGTITAKEHRGGGSHPYTLYTIKYETALDTDHPGTLQQVAYHTVNRRYSEFLNLQTRLEEKTELRKLIKNVKGPKKLFPDLPFGNMDSDKVEARKSLLESFLKQLCAIPESANCEEMQEFLALNTDARIAFVKKSIVSRIDKIMVSAIVDTLKTAFPRSEPQSPTEEVGECEVDAKSQSDGKKPTKSRLRFSSSKIAPVLNVADIQAKVTYCFNESRLSSEGLSLAGMEEFLLEHERLLEGMQTDIGGKGTRDEISAEGDVSTKRLQITPSPCLDRNLNSDSETALADVALDVLCLLMKDHWSWLCTENMQKVIRLLFGTLLERWLEVQIVNLTCTQHWIVYLRLLQEAIWPGGTLPKWPKPVRSQEQKQQTREQAYQSLMKLLPALVPEFLGEEGYRKSWRQVLDSLQNPLINRHLVYCICDLLLEFLIPEALSEEFQRSLLSCISGSTERVPN